MFEDLICSAAPRVNFYRQSVVHNFKKKIVYSIYNIILGDELIKAIVQYDKKSLVFTMKVGKSKISIVGKKFKELTQYPLALSVPQH